MCIQADFCYYCGNSENVLFFFLFFIFLITCKICGNWGICATDPIATNISFSTGWGSFFP